MTAFEPASGRVGIAEPSIGLRVMQLLGQPAPRDISARFIAPGGTIGRSLDNTLPLPDPLRQISRVHARVQFGDGRWTIECLSQSGPVIVNGQAHGPGELCPLANDDKLTIGGFDLRVELSSPPAPHLQHLPHTPPAAPSLTRPAPGSPLPAEPTRAPSAAPVRVPATPSSVASPPVASSPIASSSTDALQAGMTPGATSKGTPASAGPRPPPAAMPTPAAASIRSGHTPPPALAADEIDDVDALFGLADARDLLAADSPLPALDDDARPATPAPNAGSRLPGTVLSWLSPPETSQPAASAPAASAPAETLVQPGPRAQPDASVIAAFNARLDEASRRLPSAAAMPPATAATTAATAAPPVSTDADPLLAHFLKGAGLPALPRTQGAPQPTALTPELMERLGELLRATTEGTIQLIQARATVKREMRAEMTLIAERQNNPLKFSPDATAALSNLLRPDPVRGFLDPVAALRDAFDDLLAHQVGFVAGMRAAMAGVLDRFDPAQLELDLQVGGGRLTALVPPLRKARLWDRFDEAYARMVAEAEDDFESFFGREFVRAYERQIDLLQRPANTDADVAANPAPDDVR